jgi:hypothetical protein
MEIHYPQSYKIVIIALKLFTEAPKTTQNKGRIKVYRSYLQIQKQILSIIIGQKYLFLIVMVLYIKDQN